MREPKKKILLVPKLLHTSRFNEQTSCAREIEVLVLIHEKKNYVSAHKVLGCSAPNPNQRHKVQGPRTDRYDDNIQVQCILAILRSSHCPCATCMNLSMFTNALSVLILLS